MVETNTNNEINSYQKQTPAATPGCQQGEATHSNDKTEYRQNEKNIVAYRPRILYSAIFVWNTVTCGKFIAPLLQELSPKFTDSVIGVTLSFQYGIVATLAGFGGSLADSIERRSSKWGHGRLLVLASSIMLGTLAFIGHALPGYLEYHEEASSIHFGKYSWDNVLLWHVLMRFAYAVSMSICAPALDGLTLAHLEIIKDGAQSEFGVSCVDILLKFRQKIHGLTFKLCDRKSVCMERYSGDSEALLMALALISLALASCISWLFLVQWSLT